MAVSIVRANLGSVKEKIQEALKLINYQPNKKQIFIKPNIVNGYGSPDNGVTTHPKVIEALLQYFNDYDITVGEGSAVGQNTDEVLEVTGTKDLAKKYGAKAINLDKAPRREITWKYGRIKIPEIIFTHEYINVPSIKTHHTTQVSISLKNQKGLLRPKDKKWFHLHNLNDSIYQLSQVVKPDLVIVDGIIGIEGDGPGDITGKRKDLGLIMAGQDAIEVDNVCCQIMELDAKNIPHIPDIKNIETVGVPLAQAVSPFIPTRGLLQKYNCYLHTFNPCSGCLESLSMSLYLIKKSPFKLLKFIKAGVIGRLDFILGVQARFPDEYGKKVFIVGDCAKDFAEKNNLQLIRGCPPKPDKIVKIVL